MTIADCKEILALENYDDIVAELKRRGFREGGEDGVWEFEPFSLQTESGLVERIVQKNKRNKTQYSAVLYKENKRYEGATFLCVTLCKRVRKGWKRIPIPAKSMIFTDAPQKEGYEREMNASLPCAHCGNAFAKKSLLAYNGRWLCGECFRREMNKEGLQEVVEEIKAM